MEMAVIWASSYTKIAVGVVAAGLFALGLSEYTAHVRADAVAQATIAAQATYQKQLTSQMADLQKAISDRDTQYQQDKQDLQKQFQGSLAQVLAVIQARATLPVPLQVVTPAPTAQNPNPQPQVIVPSEDLPQAKAYIQACEQCSLDRTKAQADLADREAQMALAQKQIDSLKLERDAAVTASKGGSWIHRFGKSLKVIGCAAAGGAAGGASGKGAIPAAIGAGAGAVACSLF